MKHITQILAILTLLFISTTVVFAIVYWRETQEITQVIKPKVAGSVTKSIELPEIFEASEATYTIAEVPKLNNVINVATEKEYLKLVIEMGGAPLIKELGIYKFFNITIIADVVPNESELAGKEWMISLDEPSVEIILDKIGFYRFDYRIYVYTGDIEEAFEASIFVEIRLEE